MTFDIESIRHPRLLAHLLVNRVRNDSLLRNSVYIMCTNIANAALGFIFWIVAARAYSPFDVGLASALISVIMLASAFSNMGIGSTMVQLLPGQKAGNAWSLTLNAGVAIAIFTGLPAGIILVVALALFSQQFATFVREIGYAFTLAIGVPLMTLSTMLDQTFVAERASKYMLLRNLVASILKILLILLPVLLLMQIGALGIFSAGVGAAAISLLVGWLLLIPRLGRAYSLTTRGIAGQVRSMLSLLAGNHFINLGGLTPMYLLPLIVAMRLSPTDNAYYYMADKLDNFFFMASSVVAIALFAEGSHAASTLTRKVRSSAVVVSIVLVPTMLICFFGGRYLLLLFGSNYAQNGLLLLRIFTVAAVPDAITNIYVSVLRVQRRLRFAALLNLGMAILTLTLAWVLLPVLGIAGVGWAVLIAQGSGSLVAAADAIRFRSRRRSSTLAFQTDPDRVEAEV